MTKLIKALLISMSILSMSCSNAGLTDRVARGPTLNVQLEQAHLYPERIKTDSSYADTEPRIIIEPLTPVVCNSGNGNDFGEGSCALDEDFPLPEKIEFRYGKWLSNEEAGKRYPPIPFEAYENDHNSDNYENMSEYLAADKAFREKIRNQPKYKKIREAKRAAMEREIDWHTHTIYPRDIMQKYHDDMGFVNRLRASIVYYTITFHYDMSVTEKDRILYLDPAVPW